MSWAIVSWRITNSEPTPSGNPAISNTKLSFLKSNKYRAPGYTPVIERDEKCSPRRRSTRCTRCAQTFSAPAGSSSTVSACKELNVRRAPRATHFGPSPTPRRSRSPAASVPLQQTRAEGCPNDALWPQLLRVRVRNDDRANERDAKWMREAAAYPPVRLCAGITTVPCPLLRAIVAETARRSPSMLKRGATFAARRAL